jgi:sialic acid synthase SpsE/quercetin dioxygenase-like cupin family protein
MKHVFENLIVFEMANNHQGEVQHGLRIIHEMGQLAKRYSLNAAVKFQYRELTTFIHPDFCGRKDVPHIPRFLETQLSDNAFETMLAEVKAQGMHTMVTPFDELSVARCVEQNVDILKVASCSAADWPLLEAIAGAQKPTIISTGGLPIEDIDKVVSYFSHKNAEFAVMHCVGIYPTPPEQLQLGLVRRLAQRYHGIPVGYSGHEPPGDTDPVVAAIALGASMLERHVGVPTDEITLNKYSMNPQQAEKWIQAFQKARTMLGGAGNKALPAEEKESLRSLQRGVYLKSSVRHGEEITPENVYFAMPCQKGQLSSGEFGIYRARYVATKNYGVGEGVIEAPVADTISEVRAIIHEAKGMLYEARINLGKKFNVELSHHYGIEKFRETGCLIINIINREYCKKLIVVLPRQKHPLHRHKIKEETFQVLHGDVIISLNGNGYKLEPGDQMLVERGAWHGFFSENGCIFEEVSTTHIIGDSYYEDAHIAKLDPIQRKTAVDRW